MIYPVTKDRNLSTFDFYSFGLVRLDKSDGSGAQQTRTMTTNVFCLHCHASRLQTSAIYRNIMEQLVFLPSIPLLIHTPMPPVNTNERIVPFIATVQSFFFNRRREGLFFSLSPLPRESC